MPTTLLPAYFTNLSRKVRGVYVKPTGLPTKHATDTAHSNPWHQFRWHKLQVSFVLFPGKHFMTNDIVIYPTDGTCKYLLNDGRYTASHSVRQYSSQSPMQSRVSTLAAWTLHPTLLQAKVTGKARVVPVQITNSYMVGEGWVWTTCILTSAVNGCERDQLHAPAILPHGKQRSI